MLYRSFGPALVAVLVLGLLSSSACRPTPARSRWSYDEIEQLVAGQSAARVAGLLGEPDRREPVLDGDERWIWWSYTYLGGAGWPPEYRGKVVHLEVVFSNPAPYSPFRPPDSQWTVAASFGVSYRMPAVVD